MGLSFCELNAMQRTRLKLEYESAKSVEIATGPWTLDANGWLERVVLRQCGGLSGVIHEVVTDDDRFYWYVYGEFDGGNTNESAETARAEAWAFFVLRLSKIDWSASRAKRPPTGK